MTRHAHGRSRSSSLYPRSREICRVLLITFGSLAVMLSGCSSATTTAHTTAHTTATAIPPDLEPVVSWIRSQAITLRTTDEGAPDDDLQPLQSVVGNASIVGLGEATHGAHELFTVKARLAEYLVQSLGFTVIAMESGWDPTRDVDAYVTTGQGDARQGDARTVLSENIPGAWQTREIMDLLEWMRAYNAGPSHPTLVHFAGIDAYEISQAAFDSVVQYMQTVDPAQAAAVSANFDGIRPSLPGQTFVDARGGFSEQPAPAKQQELAHAQQVYQLLAAHQADYESRSSAMAYALALQSARVIVQYVTLGVLTPGNSYLLASTAAYDQRDAFMAENVEWLHDHVGGKMIVWAHDGHIGTLHSYVNMGALLHQRYQGSYLRVGTSFFQGSFHVFEGRAGIDSPVPFTPDTYNYTLGQVGMPVYALDIRQAPAGPAANWLQGPHEFKLYGIGGEDLSLDGSLPSWFDVIVHVQTLTPSQLLD